MITSKFDLPVSFICSVVVHGAMVAGVYTTAVLSPRLSLEGGSGSYMVSMISPSELLSASGEVARASSQTTAATLKPTPLTRALPKATLVKQSKDSFESLQTTRITSQSTNAMLRTISHQLQVPASAPASECQAGTCSSGSIRATPGLGGGASQGSSLLRSPKPPYPWAARRAGFEGKVELDVAIDSAGRVRDASIIQSSGRADCDQSARDTILQEWQFEPATLFGQPISWREKIVVVYSLRN